MMAQPTSAPTTKRKRDVADGIAQGIAQHYDDLAEQSAADRLKSAIAVPRGINNLAKAIHIATHVKSGAIVLDACCGRGGDLQKHAIQNAKMVVGIDISAESVEKAKQRALSLRLPTTISTMFFQSDLGDAIAATALRATLNGKFDAVSCQFALHYFGASEVILDTFLETVSSSLKPGGVFFGTVVCDQTIRERFLRAERTTAPGQTIVIANSLYSAEWCAPLVAAEAGGGSACHLGQAYRFTLADAVDSCVEYVMPKSTLERKAKEHGLSLEEWCNLVPFVERSLKIPHNATIAAKMHAPLLSSMTADERAVVSLYTVFAFRKE